MTFAIAVIGLVLLGVLGTVEVWQALNYDVIGFRNGGLLRAEVPILFWISFGVAVLIAAPMWLALAVVILVLLLQVVSAKAR